MVMITSSANIIIGSHQCSQSPPASHHNLSSHESVSPSPPSSPPGSSSPIHSSNINLNHSTATRNQANSSRYKTELCRPFEESGVCKYGDKCQFAHGDKELRTLQRHPKYKTELCRTFHTTGFCPYGPRCHFIHNSDESKQQILNTLKANLPRSQHTGLNLDINDNMDESDLLFYILKSLPKKLYI